MFLDRIWIWSTANIDNRVRNTIQGNLDEKLGTQQVFFHEESIGTRVNLAFR